MFCTSGKKQFPLPFSRMEVLFLMVSSYYRRDLFMFWALLKSVGVSALSVSYSVREGARASTDFLNSPPLLVFGPPKRWYQISFPTRDLLLRELTTL